MSATCRTCRHWSPTLEKYEVRELEVRDPTTYEPVAPQPFELRACASPKIRFYERPEHDGAATMDGSHYKAVLVTGEDFGCIHHEVTT